MQILGKGHYSIVIAENDLVVKKFYSSAEELSEERDHLCFLHDLEKQGICFDFKIPLFLGEEKGDFKIDKVNYQYVSRMERLRGASLGFLLDGGQDLTATENNLGHAVFQLHHQLRPFVGQWQKEFGNSDSLLNHILNDKAEKVIIEERDQDILKAVKEAAEYLLNNKSLIEKEHTISHTDLNPNNILVGMGGKIEGLVDCGSFGLTHPSISLYQLATIPQFWPKVRNSYEKSGGILRQDLLYAASTIHLAWAPLKLKELGIPLSAGEDRKGFDTVYALFCKRRL
jgi:Ser/Thr protein kinase RdoA (MazF antagonist)